MSLHTGTTDEVATAADVAAMCGGEYAHVVGTSKQFAQMVTSAIANAAVDAETMKEYQAAMDRETLAH